MNILSKIIIAAFASLLFYYCTSKPNEVVTDYIYHHNNHNIQTELSNLSDNITFEAVDLWILEGKDKIKNLAEYDSTLNSDLKVYDCIVSKDTVKCKVVEKNDWFRLLGIDSVEYDYSYFIIKDGLIIKIMAKLSNSSIDLISSKLQSIIKWASVEQPELLNDLIPEGKFLYTKKSANKWLNIIELWLQK